MDLLVAEPPAPPTSRSPAIRRRLTRVFTLETLGSVGGNLLMFAIFFYMQKRFGWGAKRNLLLASAQGVTYIIGALSINPLSNRFQRRTLLIFLHAILAAGVFVGAIVSNPVLIVILVLCYPLFSAAQWPLLESLIAIEATPAEMSRRISIYNIVWSGTGGDHPALRHHHHPFPAGDFPRRRAPPSGRDYSADAISSPRAPDRRRHLHPEPELLRVRTVAMRLSASLSPRPSPSSIHSANHAEPPGHSFSSPGTPNPARQRLDDLPVVLLRRP